MNHDDAEAVFDKLRRLALWLPCDILPKDDPHGIRGKADEVCGVLRDLRVALGLPREYPAERRAREAWEARRVQPQEAP